MTLTIYVDGAGGPDSGFGYYIGETGESFHDKIPGITNNQAEYMAIIAALKRLAGTEGPSIIYSDSQNTVRQLNHEYAINSEPLQRLARQAWPMMARLPGLSIQWIPREKNLAGKMLGS